MSWKVATAQTITTNVYVDESRGTGITCGGDLKLTMWRALNEGNINAVLSKMSNELQMDLIRLPMVALWYYWDNHHYDVRNVAIQSKALGMDVMLSVANTDGTFKTSGTKKHDLISAHHSNEFMSS